MAGPPFGGPVANMEQYVVAGVGPASHAHAIGSLGDGIGYRRRTGADPRFRSGLMARLDAWRGRAMGQAGLARAA